MENKVKYSKETQDQQKMNTIDKVQTFKEERFGTSRNGIGNQQLGPD